MCFTFCVAGTIFILFSQAEFARGSSNSSSSSSSSSGTLSANPTITTLDAEMELLLPREVQQILIEKKWESLVNQEFGDSISLPDQLVIGAQGLEVHLSGVTLKIKTFLEKPTLEQPQDRLILNSKNLQAQVTMASISINQTVTQSFGGITGFFKVKAQCSNIKLNLKAGLGHFSVSLNPLVGAHDTTVAVQDFSLSWAPGALDLAELNCDGSAGFSDLLQKQIQNISADSQGFVQMYKNQIFESLNNYFSKYKFVMPQNQKLIGMRPDIAMTLQITSFDDKDPKYILARGHLITHFLNSQKDHSRKLTLAPADMTQQLKPLQGNQQAALRLPAEFIKDFIEDSFGANSWWQSVSSGKISGFNSLMSSRFLQFFVWPELLSFSKSSLFRFDFYSKVDPQISGAGLQYLIKSDLFSLMLAPKGGAMVSFMNFFIQFKSQIDLSIKGEKLFVRPTKTSLILQHQWDLRYLNIYDPATYFATSIIQDQLLNAIAHQSLSFSLPAITLTESLSLKFKKAQVLPNADLQLLLSP